MKANIFKKYSIIIHPFTNFKKPVKCCPLLSSSSMVSETDFRILKPTDFDIFTTRDETKGFKAAGSW